MSSTSPLARGIRVLFAFAGSLGLVLVTERLLFARFRGSAWIVAPLAAALVGWLAARGAGHWSRVLIVALLVGAPLVALIGELSRFDAEVRRALDSAATPSAAVEHARASQAAKAFLERHRERASTAPTQPPADEKRLRPPNSTAPPRQFGPLATARLYFESLPRRLRPLLIGIALAVPVAFQAARMTLAHRNRT